MKGVITLAPVLYQAQAAPLGIIVQSNPGERDKLRQQLYQARNAAADEALASLSFRFSPSHPEQIYIVRGNTSL